MKYKVLSVEDLDKYGNDIYKSYQSNHLIFDSQNPCIDGSLGTCLGFLKGYIEGQDSMVFGIFNDTFEFLYGIIILDNIRTVDVTVAEVHIATSREVWGKVLLEICREMIEYIPVDIFYCQIPSIANRALGLVKRLGFKKTGYIPKALPYKNIKGEEHLYDIQILSLRKDNPKGVPVSPNTDRKDV